MLKWLMFMGTTARPVRQRLKEQEARWAGASLGFMALGLGFRVQGVASQCPAAVTAKDLGGRGLRVLYFCVFWILQVVIRIQGLECEGSGFGLPNRQ